MASEASPIEFGRPCLHRNFQHLAKQSTLMLNTGSFGITPDCVLKRKLELVTEFESFGDKFCRLGLISSYTKAVESVAEVAGARPENCAIVDNVTFATTASLQLLADELESDAEILITTWTYGAVCIEADAFFPGRVRRFQVELPIHSVDEFVEKYAAAIDENCKIRVAVIDYITSCSACQLPVSRLVSECRKRHLKVVLDAAHAIGQVPDLQVESLGVDFFAGSLTKWLMTPKSAALVWASDEYASRLRPLCISWMFNDKDIRVRHSFIGTRDISSFLAVPDAIRFIREECGGLSRIHSYCNELADKASSHLAELWQTGMLPVPDEMRAPFLRMVRLPSHLQTQEVKDSLIGKPIFSPMWNHLLNREKMDILLLNIQDVVYIRISFAIIVDMDDIREIGERILNWKVNDIVRE